MTIFTEIAFLFLKLGLTAFGGPAAHIALMEEEIVRRRQWMSRQYFLDLIGVTNLIPGPNSTEMVMQCGMHRAGFWGLVIAGICFIIPATVITIIFAFLYYQYGTLPEFVSALYGIRPVILVVIVAAVYKLGRTALKSRELAIIGACVLVFALSGGSEIIGILAGGFLGMLWLKRKDMKTIYPAAFAVPFSGVSVAPVVPAALDLSSMFWSFFKIGATFFGGGYTIFAYFQDEFIHRLGWLTQQQLLDAVAVGQFTPGPVLSSAAFIGYQLFGLKGALAATVGIFLPSFILVALIHPWLSKLRQSAWLSAFLDAVNVSAVAVMAAVAGSLGVQALTDVPAVMIAAACGLCLWKLPKINPAWLILLGGAVGISL